MTFLFVLCINVMKVTSNVMWSIVLIYRDDPSLQQSRSYSVGFSRMLRVWQYLFAYSFYETLCHSLLHTNFFRPKKHIEKPFLPKHWFLVS